jgi:hypothetical protein
MLSLILEILRNSDFFYFSVCCWFGVCWHLQSSHSTTWATPESILSWLFWKWGSCELFAQADLESGSSWPQPDKKLGLQAWATWHSAKEFRLLLSAYIFFSIFCNDRFYIFTCESVIFFLFSRKFRNEILLFSYIQKEHCFVSCVWLWSTFSINHYRKMNIFLDGKESQCSNHPLFHGSITVMFVC